MEDQKTCKENCRGNMPACIPFFAHENTVEHMSRNNKRLFLALVCVCATFLLTIIIFVHGYTVREKNWLDTLKGMNRTTSAEVAENGVHEQPDP